MTVKGTERTESIVLLTMYVHPKFRKAGIGAQLPANLVARAEELGAKKVICNVPSFRPDTMSFLEKRGFEPMLEWVKLVHFDIGQVQARPSELTYRSIGEEDAGTWASLQNSLFKGLFNYKEVTPDDYLRMIQLDTFCQDLAVFGLHKGRTAAYCVGTLLGPTGSPVQMRRLVMDGIVVTARSRHHGFWASILSEVLIRAASMGVM